LHIYKGKGKFFYDFLAYSKNITLLYAVQQLNSFCALNMKSNITITSIIITTTGAPAGR